MVVVAGGGHDGSMCEKVVWCVMLCVVCEMVMGDGGYLKWRDENDVRSPYMYTVLRFPANLWDKPTTLQDKFLQNQIITAGAAAADAPPCSWYCFCLRTSVPGAAGISSSPISRPQVSSFS